MTRALAVMLLVACAAEPARAPELRLWHTFNADETAALNDALSSIAAGGGPRVAAVLLPFGRAQNRLRGISAGGACPDLARVDATWIPSLAAAGLLLPVDEARLAGVRPVARELVAWDGRAWGLPQTLDGLALLHRGELAAPRDLDGLEALARRSAPPGGWGLSLRTDGYWFAALLRAEGGDLDAIAGPAAVRALARWVRWQAEGLVPPAEPGGDEGQLEARRFAAGEVALVVGGPWTVAALRRAGTGGEIGVLPFPGAPPRGGHAYVVPRCSRDAARAWELADRLTAPALQAAWSRRLDVIPTREAALAEASPLARRFDAALAGARPLPRLPETSSRFDDLTPALEAALVGDASPEEALAGVARAWEKNP